MVEKFSKQRNIPPDLSQNVNAEPKGTIAMPDETFFAARKPETIPL